MRNQKTNWVSLIALAVAVVLLAGLWMTSLRAPEQGGKAITVTVVHADGTQKDFHCHTDAEYLGQVLLDEKLAEGTEGPYGLEIHTVDGEKADWSVNQSYWAPYIGEEYATTGADGIVLTDGGEYRLVYTIG